MNKLYVLNHYGDDFIEDKIITVYFSKNRPLQLDLALSSNQTQSLQWNSQKEIVLYKCDNEDYEKAYEQVKKEHSSVEFIKEDNFKKDLLRILKSKTYVLFVVDDSIFTNPYSLRDICFAMDIFQGAVGFSLRLGKNTEHCYPIEMKNDIPDFQSLGNEVCAFNWTSVGNGDFGYPLELSSSFYRMKDINIMLENCQYNTPNSLEWALSQNLVLVKDLPFLLSYEKSVAFSNPINKVQKENNNRVGINPDFIPEKLLEIYLRGGRIKHENFSGFISNGCHQEVEMEIEFEEK